MFKNPLSALLIVLGMTAHADPSRDTLYQISTIDALLAGVYEPAAAVGDVLAFGDFGLGTFEALDGELILLDGQVFRAAADGRVTRVPPETGTPFIAVTHFATDLRLTAPQDQSYEVFKTWLQSQLPSPNISYAVRVDGAFDSVTYRSVPRQTKPYPPLVEVSKHQRVFEQKGIRGSLIGFWCPAFTKGINVPGFHLHFLSSDQQHAGHVLDFVLADGTVALDLTNGWEVRLPMNPAFLEADLVADRTSALHRVERGGSNH